MVLKVALAHDYLNQEGGAERVARVFCDTYPESPLYTSLYDAAAMDPSWRDRDIRTSFMQRLHPSLRIAKGLLPLYPFAFESFDLSGYDVALSSSSTFAKGIQTGPQTCHVCYCHSPARYAWMYHDYVSGMRLGRAGRAVLPAVVAPLRVWDFTAAQRVDYFIANSRNTAARITKFYRRSSTVLHPPIDVETFAPASTTEPYFLVLARLLPYKRIDVAIEAFNRLRWPLLIVGDGPDAARLRALAGPTVRFAGRVDDAEARHYLRHCQALVWPGEEDLGIAPLEALASGRPVVAYRAGGAVETLVEGVTGRFFARQTPDALMEVLRTFDPDSYDTAVLRAHVAEFDVRIFKRRLQQFVEASAERHAAGDGPGTPRPLATRRDRLIR
ncbi:MAG: glycosyltransferase [Chloroflexota bacterium]|nr:glycosyltransferase [Chloroflexota bacterium]